MCTYTKIFKLILIQCLLDIMNSGRIMHSRYSSKINASVSKGGSCEQIILPSDNLQLTQTGR